jgi:hypothetical protein
MASTEIDLIPQPTSPLLAVHRNTSLHVEGGDGLSITAFGMNSGLLLVAFWLPCLQIREQRLHRPYSFRYSSLMTAFERKSAPIANAFIFIGPRL